MDRFSNSICDGLFSCWSHGLLIDYIIYSRLLASVKAIKSLVTGKLKKKTMSNLQYFSGFHSQFIQGH